MRYKVVEWEEEHLLEADRGGQLIKTIKSSSALGTLIWEINLSLHRLSWRNAHVLVVDRHPFLRPLVKARLWSSSTSGS